MTTSELVNSALTATSAPSTKAEPPSIEAWAKFLAFQTCRDSTLERAVLCAALFGRAVRDSRQTGIRPHWLAFMGKSGTGKTHLATALFHALKGRFSTDHCAFIPQAVYWPKMIDDMRARIAAGESCDRFRDLHRWPLLFLDDIGAERDTTGFAAEKLNQLLSARVGKWTILTSNLGLEGLAKVDERIASRIVREPGNIYIELDTLDFGLRRK